MDNPFLQHLKERIKSKDNWIMNLKGKPKHGISSASIILSEQFDRNEAKKT